MVKNYAGCDMIEILVKQFRIICLGGLFLIAACDRFDSFSRPYVATVNGSRIYLDEYKTKLDQKKAMLPAKFFPGDSGYVERLEEEVLDSMITEKIMILRAQELNLEVDSRELEVKVGEIKKEYGEGFANLLAREKMTYDQWKDDIRKEMLIEKLIAADVNAHVRVSEDEAEDYFNEHSDLYKVASRVKVSQIVVRDMAAARDALEELNAGAEFSRVARERSIGPEARYGGDLGFVTRQILPEPLDEVIFKLRVDEISPIVKSSYGFHILKVLEIKTAKNRDFAECKAEVLEDVRIKKEEEAFGNWLDTLKMKAVVRKEIAVIRDKDKHK